MRKKLLFTLVCSYFLSHSLSLSLDSIKYCFNIFRSIYISKTADTNKKTTETIFENMNFVNKHIELFPIFKKLSFIENCDKEIEKDDT